MARYEKKGWVDANDFLIGLIEKEIDRKFNSWRKRQKNFASTIDKIKSL